MEHVLLYGGKHPADYIYSLVLWTMWGFVKSYGSSDLSDRHTLLTRSKGKAGGIKSVFNCTDGTGLYEPRGCLTDF